jgi:hypothetical protein
LCSLLLLLLLVTPHVQVGDHSMDLYLAALEDALLAREGLLLG